MSEQPDLFMPRAVQVANNNSTKFPDDFLDWLPDNMHVFEAFSLEATKVLAKGITHYSAYTIVEFLRHHSAVRGSLGEWKINNNHRPYLARLFDLVYPERSGLFEYRVTKKVYTDMAA